MAHGLSDNLKTGLKTGRLTTRTGRTLDGQPLAFNHSPREPLSQWFCWFNVTDGEVESGYEVRDGILNDLACIRILFGGRWTVETATGRQVFEAGEDGLALFFGPQSRRMPVSVSGSFKVMTVQLAAGAATAMGGPELSAMVDQVIDHAALAGHGHLPSRFEPAASPVEWLAVFERELAYFVARNTTPPPDPLATAFECCALARPSTSIAEFAADHGVAVRTVERVVRRDFGLPPKLVLRRARALDMAASLVGVTRREDDAELRLRYFDQSHLIREFRHFFGMTPRALQEDQHALLRINLETRQARRLVALDALGASELEPWRDPSAEPGL